MGALPSNRHLDSVTEEGGSNTGDHGQSWRPSYFVPANSPRENNGPDNSSYQNSPNNSHIPSRSSIGTTAETVDSHNSATSNLRGDAPPPYVEMVGQRSVNDR